jgi:1-aminocyclopropane-1-carboxylate deaminase
VDTQSSIERVPIQRVTARWLHRDRVVIEVLRADLIDAQLSGNKYFKLLPNLTAARNAGSNVLLSFGGPWSNHLHALAAAGARYGFQTIGLVRGEPQSTACLADAVRWGMHVHFISRTAYRRRAEPGFLDPGLSVTARSGASPRAEPIWKASPAAERSCPPPRITVT